MEENCLHIHKPDLTSLYMLCDDFIILEMLLFVNILVYLLLYGFVIIFFFWLLEPLNSRKFVCSDRKDVQESYAVAKLFRYWYMFTSTMCRTFLSILWLSPAGFFFFFLVNGLVHKQSKWWTRFSYFGPFKNPDHNGSSHLKTNKLYFNELLVVV